MSKVRGVRFSEKEDALVEEFLKKNPLLDFTTMAKVAIVEFIKNPHITLQAVSAKEKRESKNVRTI